MNSLDKQYQSLLQDIIDNGVKKEDRTGTGTISVFGRQIRHNMSEGFPLLTTKKMPFKTIVTELLWFLQGNTNIKYLVDNNCHIWDGDAYKNYITKINMRPGVPMVEFLEQTEFINKIKTDDEFVKKWGELGPIYGKQWRKWDGIDQIQEVIDTLKNNPDSRRMLVSAWNVNYLDEMTLPPCHYGFQVYTRELSFDERIDFHNKGSINKSSDYFHEHLDDMGVPKRAISLMWNQRSVDTFLGLPFNIASYGMLLSLLADEVNMIPEELIGNLGDTHLYSNHIDQSEEQISREPKPYLPKLKLSNVDILNGEFDYEILHYHSHPAIKAPLSN
jgi:thymidylate synthase